MDRAAGLDVVELERVVRELLARDQADLVDLDAFSWSWRLICNTSWWARRSWPACGPSAS